MIRFDFKEASKTYRVTYEFYMTGCKRRAWSGQAKLSRQFKKMELALLKRSLLLQTDAMCMREKIIRSWYMSKFTAAFILFLFGAGSASAVIWAGLAAAELPLGLAQQDVKPYKLTIVEEKTEIAEGLLPIAADSQLRLEYIYTKDMIFGLRADGKRVATSVQPLFMIDGTVATPKDAGKLLPLPQLDSWKQRHGGQTIWQQGEIRITMILEAIPGKPSLPKPGVPVVRQLDTLLVKYIIENIGDVPHQVGCRTVVDTKIVGNDGALFAAPATHPKQILNGIELTGKELPSFMEVLERSNLENAGIKGIFTFALGGKLEGPEKVVLTALSAARNYDVTAQNAGNNSACALYWPVRELPPQSKREIAFAYGNGIACLNDGAFDAKFSGSFEPGKRFTITAYVDDPVDGQTLALQLPKGIERIDGKVMQVVPQPEGANYSVVMWRCRVLETGSHAIRIRSSTGVTKTWIATVLPPD